MKPSQSGRAFNRNVKKRGLRLLSSGISNHSVEDSPSRTRDLPRAGAVAEAAQTDSNDQALSEALRADLEAIRDEERGASRTRGGFERIGAQVRRHPPVIDAPNAQHRKLPWRAKLLAAGMARTTLCGVPQVTAMAGEIP
jgi:hypothetical protein